MLGTRRFACALVIEREPGVFTDPETHAPIEAWPDADLVIIRHILDSRGRSRDPCPPSWSDNLKQVFILVPPRPPRLVLQSVSQTVGGWL